MRRTICIGLSLCMLAALVVAQPVSAAEVIARPQGNGSPGLAPAGTWDEVFPAAACTAGVLVIVTGYAAGPSALTLGLLSQCAQVPGF